MKLIEMGYDGEITIPKDLVETLKIKDEVYIRLNGDSIIIEPISA